MILTAPSIFCPVPRTPGNYRVTYFCVRQNRFREAPVTLTFDAQGVPNIHDPLMTVCAHAIREWRAI